MRTITASSSPDARSSSQQASTGAPAETDSAAHGPSPPAALKSAPEAPLSKLNLESGALLCAASRPDLPDTQVEIRADLNASPEEKLLLGYWLAELWVSKVPTLRVELICPDAILCAQLPPPDAQQALKELADLLSDFPQRGFYPARLKATKRAASLEESSPLFALSSAAWVAESSSPRIQALRSNATSDSKSWAQAIGPRSGSAKIKTLPLEAMHKLSRKLAQNAQITWTGHRSPEQVTATFNSSWKKSISGQGAPSRSAAPNPPLAHPILLKKETAWSTAVVSYRAELQRRDLSVALEVIAQRWRDAYPGDARVTAVPPGPFNASPLLLIEGEYARVLASLSEIAEISDEFLSSAGGPSRGEERYARLRLRGRQQTALDSRCLKSWTVPPGAPPLPGGSNNKESSLRRALRAHSPPTIVVWGNDEPVSESE